MKPKLLLALSCLAVSPAFAADISTVPAKQLAEKKELLFSDDFEGSERPKLWHKVVDTFAFENGTLKGSQTRTENIPAGPDGKGGVMAHAAVHGLELPTKDSIVEVKIKFEGASMIDVEFDDRSFTGSHYGHLCRAQVRLNGVTLIDERDGNQNEALKAMRKDPSRRIEVDRILGSHQATFPAKLEVGKWYVLVVETVGDEMRVTIDGQPAGYLKASGIAHETKSKIELGVGGKDGYFDDLKVWNAASAK